MCISKGKTVRQIYFGTVEFQSSTRFSWRKQHGTVVAAARAPFRFFPFSCASCFIIIIVFIHFE